MDSTFILDIFHNLLTWQIVSGVQSALHRLTDSTLNIIFISTIYDISLQQVGAKVVSLNLLFKKKKINSYNNGIREFKTCFEEQAITLSYTAIKDLIVQPWTQENLKIWKSWHFGDNVPDLVDILAYVLFVCQRIWRNL